MELKLNNQPLLVDQIIPNYLDYLPAILYSFGVVSGTPTKYCDLKVVYSGTLTNSGTYTFENDSEENYNIYFIDKDDNHYNFQGYILQ